MRREEQSPQFGDVGILGIFNVDYSRWMLATSNSPSLQFHDSIRPDHDKREALFYSFILRIEEEEKGKGQGGEGWERGEAWVVGSTVDLVKNR